jgi:hypothetical protein
MKADRREFLRHGLLRQAAAFMVGVQEGMAAADRKDDFERFFESEESCYALALAYPDEILIETARRCGIETEGRAKKDIAKELFQSQRANEYRF